MNDTRGCCESLPRRWKVLAGGNLVDRKWWTHYYGRRTIVANASHLRNVKRETRGESWGGRRFFRQFRRPKDSLFVGPNGRPAHFDKHEFVLARRIVAFLLRFEHTTTAEFRSLWKVGTLDLTLWARVIEMTFMFGACKLVIGITVYTGVFDQVIENLLPL